MDYNTSRQKLQLPEYGRLVQNMVSEALLIESKDDRQAYAELIIQVMATLSSDKVKQELNDIHKLWEHLAFMANYALDIDYPIEVSKDLMSSKPDVIDYPQATAKYRHYGHLTEKWIQKISEMSDDVEQEQSTVAIANYMKRMLIERRGGHVSDEKIVHDLEDYTEGKLHLNLETHRLIAVAPILNDRKH